MSDTQVQATEPQAQAATPNPSTEPAQAAPGRSSDEYERMLKEVRAEAAANRVKLREYEQRDMSEADKAKQRADDLEKQATQTASELRQERAERAVERAARQLNFVDEETALALVSGRIEYDADGKPTNVETLLKAVAESKPFLLKSADTQAAPVQRATAANPNRGATATGTFTTTQIADRRFYEANKDAIMQAYREGKIIQE